MRTAPLAAARPKTRTLARASATLLALGVTLSAAPSAHAAPQPAPQPGTRTAATAAAGVTQARKHAARTAAQRQRVLKAAFSKRNARYVYGASGPNAFDCSGYVMWVYKRAIGKNLPHYSGAQMRATARVARKHLKPGDLLFYGPGGSQHVALYIGRGKQIGANNPRTGIVIDSIHSAYWSSRYAGAGRVIR